MLVFNRCDGKKFAFDEVSTSSLSNTANALTITGGQGAYPLAYVDTDRALELTFASAQFSLDIFQIANAAPIMDGDFGSLESGLYNVSEDHKITLPFEVKQKSVTINGLEEADGGAPGKFTVTITTTPKPSTVIELDEDDAKVSDHVRVFYRRRINASSHLEVKTDTTSARGELWAHYPVYSSGTDCTDAARKGMIHIFIPRVRATALPGFESNYKTAQTFSVTFAAIDPKRPDEKMYSILYEPYNPDGSMNVVPGGGTVDWDTVS